MKELIDTKTIKNITQGEINTLKRNHLLFQAKSSRRATFDELR